MRTPVIDLEGSVERSTDRSSGLAGSRVAAGAPAEVAWDTMDSPVGRLVLSATETGLAAISFDDPGTPPMILPNGVRAFPIRDPDRLEGVRQQLAEYFAGRRSEFEVPIDWRCVQGFRRLVLQELAEVPFGEVVTYGELATRSGSPGAARAVGSAMAANPIPIVVPCHRVLRSGMRLGGYSGGLDVKRWLLAHEGIEVTP